ncbi:signal recognition particle protein [Treponema denticola]|jgi:signal recognition particle protein|uniref:Signal recognition particle protein n=3 Tax=Treponema denticola TaxID=158 RepID=M2BGD5_TREDN|nr:MULTISPECIES: signal recognition particle protein [Treponema]EMB23383.1 signal recognition particle protein [Treponema denticola OTK]EMB24097.1 signal recognition particle protein [Treponema denticola SP33]EMB26875.1 signal recognition particle protein [Treponema denticola SP37]EMB30219.1 signal recognition particle protein [Treponema denticola MYR-T]EMB31374.1 signal recognition particle protein [Treponema denticola H1-T]
MLENITEKFSGIMRSLSGKSKITEKNIEDTIEEIKTALLDADVNLRVVRRFINATAEEAKGERVLKSVDPGQQFTKIVYDKMTSFLGDEKKALDLRGPDTQSVILFLGLQGSGKTTSAAKLALKLKNEGRKPLLVACDLVRPAAVEQLSVLGGNISVPVYKEETKDAVKVAKNALAFAKKNFYDTVIVDTAGRLQIDEDMMKEIVNIKSAVKPMETILVADSMTGQSAVDVAKEFDEQVGLSGLILTKFDSDTRGGAALSLKTITGKPIFYIGTGEKLEDLEPFYPDRIASRILGMGDIVSLVEKAQALYDEEEAEKLQKKMQSESFSLADMLMQLEQAEKMGPLESMLDMIPGLSGQIDKDKLDLSLLKRQKAIIQSMTLKERDNFRIIGPPRRKRIAKGSGTSVGDVNKLLKQFEKTRQMMRKVSKNKGLQAKMMSGGLFG